MVLWFFERKTGQTLDGDLEEKNLISLVHFYLIWSAHEVELYI